MALTKLNTHGIGADVILAEDIAANAVTVSEIQDDAVTQAKVADQAIDEARMQISNAGTNGQFLSKQSGNTGGLTWADATTWTPTTEGRVTTSQGQDDIDFTIPADVNMIKVLFWGLSQVPNDNPFLIRYGITNGTLVTSGYLNTSTYWYNGAHPSVAENTDGIKFSGWNSTTNYWYGEINFSSVGQDGRRWYYHMNAYNDTYGEYFSMAHGRIPLDSGQQIRKIRFTCGSAGGYDSGGQIIVYSAEF
tara:strand:+ start:3864 stop:4607 length:744 start_codon:yes stop_codon:yes gene_type:complete